MVESKIGKAIKENCKDDKTLESLLLELLNFSLTGKSWYKDEYEKLISKYALEMEKQNED